MHCIKELYKEPKIYSSFWLKNEQQSFTGGGENLIQPKLRNQPNMRFDHELAYWMKFHTLHLTQLLEDTLSVWVKITLTHVSGLKPFIQQAMHCSMVKDMDDEWRSLKTDFGRSLWIDGARCVPSTPSWSGCLCVSGPCDSCSWKKRRLRFTMNVMPNGKRERRRQTPQAGRGPRDTSWSLVEARAHVLLEGHLSSVSALHLHFLRCLSPLSPEDSERLTFIPVGTEPRPWPFSMVFLSPGVSGPGPVAVRPSDLLAWFLPLPWARSLETWW